MWDGAGSAACTNSCPQRSPHWGPWAPAGATGPGGASHLGSGQGWWVSEPVQPAEHLPWHHCSQTVIHLFTHSATDSPIHSFIQLFIGYLPGPGTGGWTRNRTKTNLDLPLEGSLPGRKISHKQIESHSRDTCWGRRPPRCDEIVRGVRPGPGGHGLPRGGGQVTEAGEGPGRAGRRGGGRGLPRVWPLPGATPSGTYPATR